ncbi:quinone oxidoreductase family protein [Salmonirosea aquatica]|uniref:Zinc-binding dehydrogenase n=1 Tax=Salmonirosea aquatica TaxID=2654236 RepID=A0A7C9BBG6_9BACT|nr:zinc-binding dehydrogenase [Cytophagaceae bacterium SJW1-29]
MKAAVLHQLGTLPIYEDFQDPIPRNETELLLHVKAASVKNLDKLRASGQHYASYTHLPVVVGMDGVGTLENGTRVYAQGLTGMIAEKALVAHNRYTILPERIDDVTAAALPNAVMGAALALRFRAKIEKGDTVLINGATGVTGQVAVQIARHYGAAKIIATGRNPHLLQKLTEIGADEVLSLEQEDGTIVEKLKELNAASPIGAVIDYLWGHPIELIVDALKSSGATASVPRVRLVSVGSMAGETIRLDSGSLRSSVIELLGSGLGSFTPQEMQKFSTEVLPEMFQLAADGKLHIGTETAAFPDIAASWVQKNAPGKRLVICI